MLPVPLLPLLLSSGGTLTIDKVCNRWLSSAFNSWLDLLCVISSICVILLVWCPVLSSKEFTAWSLVLGGIFWSEISFFRVSTAIGTEAVKFFFTASSMFDCSRCLNSYPCCFAVFSEYPESLALSVALPVKVKISTKDCYIFVRVLFIF